MPGGSGVEAVIANIAASNIAELCYSRRKGIPVYIRVALLTAMSAIVPSSNAVDPSYSITSHIVSNGSSAHLSSACFRLEAVIAEPVTGISTSADYALTTGFHAVGPDNNDGIFFSAFEDCSQ